jgi:ribonuclease J
VSRPSPLEIIPLGGLGEFGMNLMVYRSGDDCLVVDAGVSFPHVEHLGVDLIRPDLSFLDSCGRLHGIVLTHGHEDHIGAVPFVLERHAVPVWAGPYTGGLVRRRLVESHPALSPRFVPLPRGEERVSIGPFAIEAVPVRHSIPEACMVVLRTPGGIALHTADFKLGAPGEHDPALLDRLARLGAEGVLVLLSDSTNADRPGSTPGEHVVADGLESVIEGAPGRVLVATFSSHLERMERLARIAERHGRKLALAGASILSHVENGERMGLVRWPAGVRVSVEQAMELPRSRVVIVTGGSQGEPASSLMRVALGRHHVIDLEPDDVVVHSARTISGNERRIARMLNCLVRAGARVVTPAEAPVHVSGHGASDELRLLIRTVRPRSFVPIHGEYRQLAAHAALATDCGVEPSRVVVAESGDRIEVREDAIEIVDRIPLLPVLLDTARRDVDRDVLRERRRLAGAGVLVPVVVVDRARRTARLRGELDARGWGWGEEGNSGPSQAGAEAAVRDWLAEATGDERGDPDRVRSGVETALRRYLRQHGHARPLIVPVVVEL